MVQGGEKISGGVAALLPHTCRAYVSATPR